MGLQILRIKFYWDLKKNKKLLGILYWSEKYLSEFYDLNWNKRHKIIENEKLVVF